MKKIVKHAVCTGQLEIGETVYTAELTLAHVMEAEKALGEKSLKWLPDWYALPWESLAVVLYAALRKHHPDVTLQTTQDICDGLNPESLNNLRDALCWLAWPESMKAMEEAYAKKLGAVSPNAESGAAA